MATSMSDGGSAEQGEGYYPKQAQHENYYLNKNELGKYGGKGLEQIGIPQGSIVDEKSFKDLLRGYNPDTKEKLVANAGKDRERAFFDITNSPPKSFSILVAQLKGRGDFEKANELIELHEKANLTVMETIQDKFTKTRISTGKKDPVTGKTIMRKIHTDGLMFASFKHDVAREVKEKGSGSEGKIDPQEHIHNVIFNQVTYTGKDGKIKTTAMSNDDIYTGRVSLELEYNTLLANLLKSNGIDVELANTKRGEFEIKGVSQEQIDEFSSRRKLIEKLLPEYQKKYPNMPEGDLKDLIVKNTKSPKGKIDGEKVLSDNRKRMENVGFNDAFADNLLKDFKKKDLTLNKDLSKINDYLEEAVQSISERSSTFSLEDVMVYSMKKAALKGFDFTRKDMEKSFHEKVLSKDGQNENETFEIGSKEGYKVYSTRAVIEAEQDILMATKRTSPENKVEAYINDPSEINNIIDTHNQSAKFHLTNSQERMIRGVLSSKSRFLAIQGDAGAGKTTSIKVAVDEIKNRNPDIEVMGISYQGAAVKELTEAGGIDSTTLHSYLATENRRKKERTQRLLVLDESTMAGSIQISELLRSAHTSGDRVLFIGDTKQLKSIAAGQVLDDMIKYGMETIYMDESVRQQNAFSKELVKSVKDRDFDKTMELMQKGGEGKGPVLYSGTTKSSMIDGIMEQYHQDKEQYQFEEKIENRRAQLMAAFNTDRRELNDRVREVEKGQHGFLEGEDHTFQTYENQNFQNIESQYNGNYAEGMVIHVRQPIPGLRSGDKLTVKKPIEGTTTKIVAERGRDGKMMEIDLSEFKSTNVQVYQPAEKPFAVGEKFLYTKNDKKGLGVQNGMTDTIVKIGKDGTISTKRGKSFKTKDYPFIDYSYCRTIHSMQGGTGARTISLAGADMTTTNIFYVDLTRHKDDAKLWVDDLEKFRKNIEKIQSEDTTLDFLHDKNVKEILEKEREIQPKTERIQDGRVTGNSQEKRDRDERAVGDSQEKRDRDERNKTIGRRDEQPVDNIKEREYGDNSLATGVIGDAARRRITGESNARSTRKDTKSVRAVVTKIGELIKQVSEKINELRKKKVLEQEKVKTALVGKKAEAVKVLAAKKKEAKKAVAEKAPAKTPKPKEQESRIPSVLEDEKAQQPQPKGRGLER